VIKPGGCKRAGCRAYGRLIVVAEAHLKAVDIICRQALIETAIVTNAALSAYSIQQEFIANDLPGSRAAYGVYILETRELWAPRSCNIERTGLAPAPCNPVEFADFGNAIVQSERIVSYLN
jgi:carbonic anhydrase